MSLATKAKNRAKLPRATGRKPILATALVLVGMAYAVSLFQ
ncbi:hypothetical protein [Hyphomonas sp.]|jgi:hypothetical protein|nr:hypothetical protein [Hyphomonas sp.]